MGIKRTINLIIFLLIFATSYFYLSNNYNKDGIEIRLDTKTDYNDFKDNIMGGILKSHSINYEKSFNGHKLIMTTGMDMQFKRINMEEGECISPEDRDLIVLGDKVSNKYFMTKDSLGMNINLMDKKYRIKGIIKNSNEIYIPYDKSLLSQDWDNTFIRIEPNIEDGISEYNRRKNSAFFSINQMGMKITDSVYYGDVINFYKNLSLGSLILGLIFLIKNSYYKFRHSANRIWLDYKKQSRKISLLKYKLENIKKILKETLRLFNILFLTYLTYKVFKQISFNKEYFPDNIFSIRSYYLVIRNYYNKWIFRLENGLTDVLMDFVKVNLIFTVTVFVFLIKDKIFRKYGGVDIGRNKVEKVEEGIS